MAEKIYMLILIAVVAINHLFFSKILFSNIPINVRSNLLDIELIGTAIHEFLRICDIEEINFKKQIDWWPLPHLEDFTIVFKKQFLLKE